MTRIAIPSRTCQAAHTVAGDVSRITTALNGASTHAALVSADLARKRAIDQLRALGGDIRRLKSEARKAERYAAMMRSADMAVLS
jgi:hypothetical protein